MVFAVFGFSEMRNWQSLRLKQEKRELEKDRVKIGNTIEKIANDLDEASNADEVAENKIATDTTS